MSKYIFVTGGVVSALGKGITAASLGRILKNRGLSVFMQKFDPYINVDPGTMSPYQHGECFVTKDGAETDLDLGHYERFIDVELTEKASVTTGKIYKSVLEKERRGDYLGATVQVIPHVTNEIKGKIYGAANASQADVIITEIGGTVGDYESLPYIETIRQVKHEKGRENVLFLHTTLVPYVKASGELKTKPTQHSVKELRSYGIQPDIIVCRTEMEMPSELKEKIALFCDVEKEAVIEAVDHKNLYEIPLSLEKQGLDDLVLSKFNIKAPKADMKEWKKMVDTVNNLDKEVSIAIVGKYTKLQDSYLSVAEALKHAGFAINAKVNLKWVNSEEMEDIEAKDVVGDVDGILIPGGFGGRGIEGKISVIKYARENKIPLFGICLGLQLITIEYARNVCKIEGANSSEWDEECKNPVITILPGQDGVIDLGGTLRLGNWPCKIEKDTKAFEAYKSDLIDERHRHRYEVNNEYRDQLIKSGLVVSGSSPDDYLVEIVELKDHPWMLGCQFHPEFKSRPTNPHPLFREFVKASFESKK